MNFPFKETRKKLLAGDFSGLFRITKDKKNSFIHPSEVAKLFTSIPTEKAIEAFKSFQTEQEVDVFPYLDNQLQKKIVRSLTQSRAADILNELSSDDRTIFYSTLKGVELSNFLEILNDSNRTSLHKALNYSDKSVARIINTEFASIESGMTINSAMEHLRKNHKDTETANVIYVVDKDGRLIDDIPVRRFVLNDPQKKLKTY